MYEGIQCRSVNLQVQGGGVAATAAAAAAAAAATVGGRVKGDRTGIPENRIGDERKRQRDRERERENRVAGTVGGGGTRRVG